MTKRHVYVSMVPAITNMFNSSPIRKNKINNEAFVVSVCLCLHSIGRLGLSFLQPSKASAGVREVAWGRRGIGAALRRGGSVWTGSGGGVRSGLRSGG